MTDRELMQKALEALEEPKEHIAKHRRLEAITALRERLAESIDLVRYEYKPVAWISEGGDVSRSKRYMDEMGFKCNPLYTPPQPEPVIDKSAAIRIATALGWVPPSDTSQERVDQEQKQRQEQEPTVKWDASAPLVVTPHPAFQATQQRWEWVGLTEEDFSAINQSCLTKLQAATSAESILKEKNNG